MNFVKNWRPPLTLCTWSQKKFRCDPILIEYFLYRASIDALILVYNLHANLKFCYTDWHHLDFYIINEPLCIKIIDSLSWLRSKVEMLIYYMFVMAPILKSRLKVIFVLNWPTHPHSSMNNLIWWVLDPLFQNVLSRSKIIDKHGNVIDSNGWCR